MPGTEGAAWHGNRSICGVDVPVITSLELLAMLWGLRVGTESKTFFARTCG